MTSRREALSQALRAVVGTQPIRQSPGFQLLEHTNQTHTGQRVIDLYCQDLPVEVILHIEGPQPPEVCYLERSKIGDR